MKYKNVKTRKDFILFLKELNKDFQRYYERNKGKEGYAMENDWAHLYVGDFLGAISAWLEGSGKYKKNNLSWNDFADIIESGKVYE